MKCIIIINIMLLISIIGIKDKDFEQNIISEIKCKNIKDNKLLQIYKSKLIEEFIIVLTKYLKIYQYIKIIFIWIKY